MTDRHPSRTTDRGDDRQAVTDLLHSYAWHFDLNQPDAVARLFTEDAIVDYGPEVEPLRGRRQIEVSVASGLAEIFEATSHHISNVSIEFEGEDAAIVDAYVYAWHRYRNGSPDGYLWGRYRLTCRRLDSGWHIARLVLAAAGTTAFHRASINPIGRRP